MQKPRKTKTEYIYSYITVDYGTSAANLINIINNSIARIRQQADKEFNKKIKGEDIQVEITNRGLYAEEDYSLKLSVSFEIDNPNYEYEMKEYSKYIDKILEETKETRAWLDREEAASERNYNRWQS